MLRLVPRNPAPDGRPDPAAATERWEGAPETVLLVATWVLSVVYVLVAVTNAQHLSSDACLALAYALGCPFLLKAQAVTFFRTRRHS